MKTVSEALKNWITTVIGVIVMVVAIWFVKSGDMPWWGIIPLGIFSAWMVYAKDSDLKKAFNKLKFNERNDK